MPFILLDGKNNNIFEMAELLTVNRLDLELLAGDIIASG
jgi:hypothetical protein